MNITDPKYFQEQLREDFSKVTLRDYYKLRQSKPNMKYNEDFGKVILIYEDPLSVSINYIEHKRQIEFNIEYLGHTVLRNTYKYDLITRVEFSFFHNLIRDYKNFHKDMTNRRFQFVSRSIPIDYMRDQKLKEVFDEV
jgi:hypothetical protein